MSPVGLETKNHCAGEGQQQFSSQTLILARSWFVSELEQCFSTAGPWHQLYQALV
jgi:hypothetical protein